MQPWTYISELPTIYSPEINNSLVIHNYLALGDSYTIGQGVNEQERFPDQLTAKFAQKNYLVSEPLILAKTGWTTANLDAAIISENLTETFDIVTLLIGVNNQFQGRSIAKFQIQFSDLLTKAITFAKNKPENVIVVSIPDWGVSPYANSLDRAKISKEIDAFNEVKKEETLKMNAKFVDITPISRLALNNSEFIASDNLHFSGEMYGLWVEEIIRTFYGD